MSEELPDDSQREIGHVLFMDIVGYSKVVIEEQRELQQKLNAVVRRCPQFSAAEAEGKLVRLPTGDGMALVFFNSGEAPIRCALEVSQGLRAHPELRLRMGIHTGPVSTVTDVNDRSNIAGAGINIAQRVMDLGDAGHILLSKRAAEDLAQYRQWQPHLHDLGQFEAKHGVKIDIVNYHDHEIGNAKVPEKLAADRRKQIGRRRRNRILIAAAIILAAVVPIALSIFLRRPAANLASKILEKSIAVLPFESFSDDKENAYFADGVQDDILTDLTKVADLKVISRRSVAQYRGGTKDVREIGQALRVAYVLEGSVRKVAGKIHVNAQLIDTRSEAQTWAEKYERDLADVFAIQSEISQAIVTKLKAALSPAEKAAIEEKPTQDQEAYDLYLRARALVYQFGTFVKPGRENNMKAVTLLESAIARDPKFTLAYCLLGSAQLNLYGLEFWNRERLPKAREAIDAALRISSTSGEAHLALADYCYQALRDPERAEKELAIASVALPGEVEVFQLAANIASQKGQWKKALHDWEKAIELDPRNPWTALSIVDAYIDVRKYSEADRMIERMVTSLPQNAVSIFWRQKSRIALAKGDTKAAMKALDASPNRNAGLAGLNTQVANVFFLDRQYAKAEEILQSLEETARAHNVLPEEGINSFGRGHRLEQLGRIARAQGQSEKARDFFASARPGFEEWLAKNPDELSEYEGYARGYIGEIDVALGRKEEGIREARHALELWPQSRDARVAPQIATLLAIVYAWSGERDAALQQLASLVKLPAGPTAGDLKLNPVWDDLRSDSRFSKIIADAAQPLFVKPDDR